MRRRKWNYKIVIRNILIIVVLIFLLLRSGTSKAMKEKDIFYYNVSAGENLWNISKEYCNNSKDIRTYIEEIKALNNMTDSKIYEGQTIKLIKEY